MAHLKRDSRRVLVIDRNSVKLNLRATVLRNYEVQVHTAASLEEAGSLWTSNYYDLVMVAAQEDPQSLKEIADRIRRCNPKQRIAVLEGAPTYVRELAPSPAKVREKAASRPVHRELPPVIPSQWEETVRRLLPIVSGERRQFA